MGSDFDLVIRGGTLVIPGMVVQADLGIREEKIAVFGQGLSGKEMIDAQGMFVIPGAIDPHVHLDMPAGAFHSSDTFESGSKAAAFGGTTTIIDFVEPSAEQSLMEGLNERRSLAERGSVLDFGLHMTIDGEHIDRLSEIPDMITAGVTSFKMYTTYDFRLDDRQFLEALSAVSDSNALAITHCENDAIIEREKEKLLRAGAVGPSSHPLSRPAAAEGEAIERILSLSEVVQASIYIVHVSTARGARAVARARSRGQAAYGETCPQYLLLTDNEYQRPGFEGAKFVCSPPLRKTEDNETLWRSLSEGNIMTVGTDHCPFFYQGQKDYGKEDFSIIPGGIPGIEARLALMYTYGVGSGNISLNRWIEVCCTNPARIFGLYPEKGALLPGADADVVIFDPQKKVTINPDLLHENVDYTPYDGFNLCGYPVVTIRRGEVMARDGEWLGKEKGHFLKRAAPVIGKSNIA